MQSINRFNSLDLFIKEQKRKIWGDYLFEIMVIFSGFCFFGRYIMLPSIIRLPNFLIVFFLLASLWTLAFFIYNVSVEMRVSLLVVKQIEKTVLNGTLIGIKIQRAQRKVFLLSGKLWKPDYHEMFLIGRKQYKLMLKFQTKLIEIFPDFITE
jgi:hypothetical protein